MAASTADRLLRLSEVQTRTALGRTTIYRKMREGSFPSAAEDRSPRRPLAGVRDRGLAGQPVPGPPATDHTEEALAGGR